MTPAAEGGLEPGDYRFTVVADGIELSAQCDPAGDPQIDCEFEGPTDSSISAALYQGADCSDADRGAPDGLTLSIAKRIGDINNGDISGPENVGLTIERDGATLSATSHQPSYTRDEPNGPGCGYCDYAAEHVTLEDR